MPKKSNDSSSLSAEIRLQQIEYQIRSWTMDRDQIQAGPYTISRSSGFGGSFMYRVKSPGLNCASANLETIISRIRREVLSGHAPDPEYGTPDLQEILDLLETILMYHELLQTIYGKLPALRKLDQVIKKAISELNPKKGVK